MIDRLLRDATRHELIDGEVEYAALVPPEHRRDERLPLVLLLHGADSSRESLAALAPLVEQLWQDGSLPRVVFGCASTPTVGGFYLDQPGGSSWETFVAEAFPALLAERFGTDPARRCLLGSSMGGYGALNIAFAAPQRWLAVAALSPALLPALAPEQLRPRNTLGVLGALGRAMAEVGFARSGVPHRLRVHADEIRAAAPGIFLRCGDHDAFALHDGTELVHRALWELDIAHEYHLVLDGDHIGPEVAAGQRAALRFLAARLRASSGADRSDEDRAVEAAWQDWAAGGRQGAPPALDPAAPSAPTALRAMIAPLLDEAARHDPTVPRRYGLLPDRPLP
jgi:S-formylglutathione hydrolase